MSFKSHTIKKKIENYLFNSSNRALHRALSTFEQITILYFIKLLKKSIFVFSYIFFLHTKKSAIEYINYSYRSELGR